jgi:hypothetical protein
VKNPDYYFEQKTFTDVMSVGVIMIFWQAICSYGTPYPEKDTNLGLVLTKDSNLLQSQNRSM